MAAPSYHTLGDHREVVEVTFDPTRTSYEKLLEYFWSLQPTNIPPGPSRVKLGLLPQGPRQRRLAEESLALIKKRQGRTFVDLLVDQAFWAAEAMHQKSDLQRGKKRLVEELSRAFTDREAFLMSRAATRINAALGGFVDDVGLAEAAADLGLTLDELKARIATSTS